MRMCPVGHGLYDAACAGGATGLPLSRLAAALPCCQAHRPAFSSDGDYFSKPNAEDVFDTVYELMSETAPEQFPAIY